MSDQKAENNRDSTSATPQVDEPSKPKMIETGADGAASANAPIVSLQEMKDLHNELKNMLDKNLERFAPLEKLNDLISILSARHLSTSQPPSSSQDNNLEEGKESKSEEVAAFGVSSEEDRFLYEDLIAGAANRLVQHGKTQNARFTELVKTSINSLCDLLVVELRLQRPSCFLLIKALSPIFAYQKPFYTSHYQKIMPSTQPVSQASGGGATSTVNNAKADLSKFS